MGYIIKTNKIFYDFLKNLDVIEQKLRINEPAPLVFHKYSNQLTYVKQGWGLVALNRKISGIASGDLILIPAKMSHTFLTVKKEIVLLHYYWPRIKEGDREIVESVFRGWEKIINLRSYKKC